MENVRVQLSKVCVIQEFLAVGAGGHRHSQEFVLGGRQLRRQGGREWGEGLPLPSRLGGLGEHRKLPQWGPGQSRKRILEYLEPEKNTPDSHKSVIFDISVAYI